MFMLTPIVINLSFTSKQARVCSLAVIVTSLEVPKISQAFPLVALLGFLSVRAKKKGLKLLFYCLRVRDVSLSVDIISQISMVEMCKNGFQRWFLA